MLLLLTKDMEVWSMRMKKVMALILSSAMICAAVPAEVLAAEEVPAEFSDNVDEENSDTLERV